MITAKRESNAVLFECLDARRGAVETEPKRAKVEVSTPAAAIVSDYAERTAGFIQKVVEGGVVHDANKRASNVIQQRDEFIGTSFGSTSCTSRIVTSVRGRSESRSARSSRY